MVADSRFICDVFVSKHYNICRNWFAKTKSKIFKCFFMMEFRRKKTSQTFFAFWKRSICIVISEWLLPDCPYFCVALSCQNAMYLHGTVFMYKVNTASHRKRDSLHDSINCIKPHTILSILSTLKLKKNTHWKIWRKSTDFLFKRVYSVIGSSESNKILKNQSERSPIR